MAHFCSQAESEYKDDTIGSGRPCFFSGPVEVKADDLKGNIGEISTVLGLQINVFA